jgi:hypothetical protein
MKKPIDFEALNRDFFAIFEKNGLNPKAYGVTLQLSLDEFDEIVKDHPELSSHPGIILISRTEIDGLQWAIQVLRKLVNEDFQSKEIQDPSNNA